MTCTCGHVEDRHARNSRGLRGACLTADCRCLVFEPNQQPTIGNHAELENFIAAANQQAAPWPDAAERCRYALLQASATLLASPNANGDPRSQGEAVLDALELLDQINARMGAKEDR